MDNLPSLAALRVFESVARQLSFTAAARDRELDARFANLEQRETRLAAAERRLDAGRRGLLRTELATGTGSGTLSEHLAASLAALDRLSALDDEALAATRPVRAEDVVERRHLTPGQWDPLLIELVQGAGLARTVPADQALAATVGALDGTLTLGQVIAAVCALTDADVEETRARILPAVRELALTGMVTL